MPQRAAAYYDHPTTSNSPDIVYRHTPEEWEHDSASTRVVLLARVHTLIADFLALKTSIISPWQPVTRFTPSPAIEHAVYDAIDTPEHLVARLIVNRPLVFVGRTDTYRLCSGERGLAGDAFEAIGTPEERPPLVLAMLQSYDEMALAALVGVSSHVRFINNGARLNRAVPMQPGQFTERGVYVAQVGARFERPRVMESRFMIVDPDVSTAANGYGPGLEHPMLVLWARFYSVAFFPTYTQVASYAAANPRQSRFARLPHGRFLDTLVYRRRIAVAAETFLLEANERARDAGAKAFCHVVGLGMGYWAVSESAQAKALVGAYVDALDALRLDHIDEVYFARLPKGDHTATESLTGVKLSFGSREPADPLPDGDNRLLVCQFAWDSNAYVGNEYYNGVLAASGDPAAACSCALPWLMNPDENPEFVERVHVL